jgi:tetratricopeptide (TPR) repeat protein
VSLAREVAIRDGIKALVAGDIAHAGGAFVISARLVSGASGEALVALRETAEDSSRILGAVDRLSREMRKRVGESLRSVQGREPLEQVTTGSLDALRKYSLAQSANREGDPERAISLLREAVALDSGFAMAYRKLGISIVNTGGRRSAQADAFTRAYQHRDRLTDRERYLTQAAYASYVLGDREQAITAYRSLLDVYPNDMVALNNLSIAYFELRNYAEAAELARRAIAASPEDWTMYANLVNAQWTMGQVDSAAATIRLMRSRTTGGGYTAEFDAQQATVRGDYDSATAILRGQRDARRDSPTVRTEISGQLAGLAALQGRLREADQYLQDAEDGQVARGLPEQALMAEVARAAIDIWYRGRTARGLRRTEAALQRRPLAAVDPIDRPYLALAIVYAEAGRPDRARALLAEFDRTASPGLRRMAETDRHGVLGTIALAERRPRDAIAEFRLQDQTSCPVCASANLGRAYDLAGEADSAIASYERYLSTPYTFRQFVDAIWLARTYVRLAELYEERHDRVKAADYYARFVRLWKNADPELQPKVLDAKRRLASLTGEAPTT